ncbi:MAG TPA: SDR family NAD(P)-dependent oxidoreductase, partial [Microthrixaceae bacterium]|nr:SDR family NAD(P)-dependent oxidoreductase [Microthrixaceae bacterium]
MGLLDGKVAIVTGAGHGIGRGHALELAKQGAKVVVNDLGGSVTGEGKGRDADLTVDLIKERGGEAVANYGDVSDVEQSAEMIAQAIDTWGRLDILVNNAGIVRDGSIFNMSVEDFDAVIKVHVRGTWLPCKHAAVHWRQLNKSTGEKVNGRIINTVSG